jgi:3-hydroxyacyl-[acyl-carrier-protein] dehydratase
MNLPPYDIIATLPDEVRIALHLDAAHPAFLGHFPGLPMLAGVIQVDWAMQLASHLGIGQRAANDFALKCRHIIRPGRDLSLILRLDRTKGLLAFEYRLDELSATRGRIQLEAA